MFLVAVLVHMCTILIETESNICRWRPNFFYRKITRKDRNKVTQNHEGSKPLGKATETPKHRTKIMKILMKINLK